MRLHCPDCGELVHGADVHLANETAKCRICHGVFSFAHALEGVENANRAVHNRPETIARPVSLRHEDNGYRLFMSWRWFKPAALFLVFFCIGWDAFLIFWYTKAFGENADWLIIVFPVAHLAVGIGLTYYTICLFLNRTVVVVDQESLQIRHTPLPWRGQRRLAVTDIAKLSVGRRASHHRSGTTHYVQLRAILRNGTQMRLVEVEEDDQIVRFAKQELEKKLKLRSS